MIDLETELKALTPEDFYRVYAERLQVWRLCGNASCRRARACRGRPRLCGPANYPLLPDGVRGWFEMLAEAKEEGLSFEEARAWLDGTDEEQAFRDWSAAVKGSSG